MREHRDDDAFDEAAREEAPTPLDESIRDMGHLAAHDAGLCLAMLEDLEDRYLHRIEELERRTATLTSTVRHQDATYNRDRLTSAYQRDELRVTYNYLRVLYQQRGWQPPVAEDANRPPIRDMIAALLDSPP